MGENAILVVSFGTSYPDIIKKCIEKTEDRIGRMLPSYELRRSFTSDFIIKKLEKMGMDIDDPHKALQRLYEDGFKNVLVQPLHIIPGYEYHDIYNTVEDFKRRNVFDSIFLGEPLLYQNEDYETALNGLKELNNTKSDSAYVIMGHGTSHFSNACYYCLQSHMEDRGLNAFIANVEGYPHIEKVILKLQQKGIKNVVLMPFMLVAGDHAQNDMAGEDSWKSILKKNGFKVEVDMRGLGEREEFQEIFAQKAFKLLALYKRID